MQENAQLTVMMYVDSVEQAHDYYAGKLGFRHMMGMLGKDGLMDFCSVSLGGARIMLMRAPAGMAGTEGTGEKKPIEIYLQVADVDSYFAQLRKAKVPTTSLLTDQWWGDRTFTVQDPFGYTVWFYQTVADAVLPPGAKVV